MPEISDTARRIINAGTPDDCVGCYYPITRGMSLGDGVEKGDLAEAEAIEQLKQELTRDCKFGRQRRILGRGCLLGVNRDKLEALRK